MPRQRQTPRKLRIALTIGTITFALFPLYLTARKDAVYDGAVLPNSSAALLICSLLAEFGVIIVVEE